jgi:hydroxymethylpyrimidine/phosphomethylpyrimidine kinase
VLLKGGHGHGETVTDLLLAANEEIFIRHPRLHTRSSHGTGCTLSSAIAARLALGDDLETAVRGAIDYLRGAMAAAYPIGGGQGPVDHLYRLFPRSAE